MVAFYPVFRTCVIWEGINATESQKWVISLSSTKNQQNLVYHLTMVVNTSFNARRNMTVPKSNKYAIFNSSCFSWYSFKIQSFIVGFFYRLPMYKCGSDQNKAQTPIHSNSLTIPRMQPLIMESRQKPRSTFITVSIKGRKSTPQYIGGDSPILSGDFLAIGVI